MDGEKKEKFVNLFYSAISLYFSSLKNKIK